MSNASLMGPLLTLGMVGCAANASLYHPQAQSECGAECRDGLIRRETVELEGNPNVGTIIHLRQMHQTLKENETEAREIGRYQYEIYQELLKQDIPDVFVEELGLPPTCSFSDSLEGPLSDQGLACFYSMGGAAVYAQARHGVILHHTQTAEERARIYQVVLSSSIQDLMALNESFAPPHVLDFLDQHPGTKVALVFGAVHYFADDLIRLIPDPKKRPVLISVCWRVPEDWAVAPLINPICPR
jgi:hypothetical protein